MANQKSYKNFNPGRLLGPGRLLIFYLFSTLDDYLAMDVYSALESIYGSQDQGKTDFFSDSSKTNF